MLQRRNPHLKALPLPQIHRAQPLLLIGSYHPPLLVPINPVHIGPLGGPVTVQLGWVVQYPASLMPRTDVQQCLFSTIVSPATELLMNVENLWQVDTFLYLDEKEVIRSKQDQFALNLLEEKTTIIFGGGSRDMQSLYSGPPRAHSFMLQNEQ